MTNSDTAFGTANKITKIYSQLRIYHVDAWGNKIVQTGGSWHPGMKYPFKRVVAADDDTELPGAEANADDGWGVLKRAPADILKETHPNNFGDVAAAKAKLLSTKGLAVWEDNATNIQWALDGDNHKLKVTADFGTPADPDQKPWAEKFKEEYTALADLSKVANTGLYNSALDFTTWGDTSAQLDADAAASGDPTDVDPKRLNAGEYAGGSMAPDGNDGKMSMGWEEDSSDHLF